MQEELLIRVERLNQSQNILGKGNVEMQLLKIAKQKQIYMSCD